jgi:hypothetical protein
LKGLAYNLLLNPGFNGGHLLRSQSKTSQAHRTPRQGELFGELRFASFEQERNGGARKKGGFLSTTESH